MSSHLIELRDITVEYKTAGHLSKRVLDNLNLRIEAGELLAVCGQTGCGKSTMLRLILGAELPASGQILIDGHESRRPDRSRVCGPPKCSLFPDKIVLGNIAFGPEMEEFGLFGWFHP